MLLIIVVVGIAFTPSSLFLLENAYAINSDPLPSWNQGKVKQTIIDFVRNVTDPSNANYVPPDKRIATFDNDGTLWSEKPLPFQVYFSFDRVPSVIAKNPDLKNRSPFKEILGNLFILASTSSLSISANARSTIFIWGTKNHLVCRYNTLKH